MLKSSRRISCVCFWSQPPCSNRCRNPRSASGACVSSCGSFATSSGFFFSSCRTAGSVRMIYTGKPKMRSPETFRPARPAAKPEIPAPPANSGHTVVPGLCQCDAILKIFRCASCPACGSTCRAVPAMYISSSLFTSSIRRAAC